MQAVNSYLTGRENWIANFMRDQRYLIQENSETGLKSLFYVVAVARNIINPRTKNTKDSVQEAFLEEFVTDDIKDYYKDSNNRNYSPTNFRSMLSITKTGIIENNDMIKLVLSDKWDIDELTLNTLEMIFKVKFIIFSRPQYENEERLMRKAKTLKPNPIRCVFESEEGGNYIIVDEEEGNRFFNVSYDGKINFNYFKTLPKDLQSLYQKKCQNAGLETEEVGDFKKLFEKVLNTSIQRKTAPNPEGIKDEDLKKMYMDLFDSAYDRTIDLSDQKQFKKQQYAIEVLNDAFPNWTDYKTSLLEKASDFTGISADALKKLATSTSKAASEKISKLSGKKNYSQYVNDFLKETSREYGNTSLKAKVEKRAPCPSNIRQPGLVTRSTGEDQLEYEMNVCCPPLERNPVTRRTSFCKSVAKGLKKYQYEDVGSILDEVNSILDTGDQNKINAEIQKLEKYYEKNCKKGSIFNRNRCKQILDSIRQLSDYQNPAFIIDYVAKASGELKNDNTQNNWDYFNNIVGPQVKFYENTFTNLIENKPYEESVINTFKTDFNEALDLFKEEWNKYINRTTFTNKALLQWNVYVPPALRGGNRRRRRTKRRRSKTRRRFTRRRR